MANNVAEDSLIDHTYEEDNALPDWMTKTYMTWHTKEDQQPMSDSKTSKMKDIMSHVLKKVKIS